MAPPLAGGWLPLTGKVFATPVRIDRRSMRFRGTVERQPEEYKGAPFLSHALQKNASSLHFMGHLSCGGASLAMGESARASRERLGSVSRVDSRGQTTRPLRLPLAVACGVLVYRQDSVAKKGRETEVVNSVV